MAEALKRSPSNPEIVHVCPTRNPGIRRLAEEQVIVDSLMNFPVILDVAKRVKPDFAFIAPDDPIGGGLADEMEKLGIPSVAPKKSLARIESSKGFARGLLKKYGIDASPRHQVFKQEEMRNAKSEMRSYMERELRGNYVVKYDGLLGGKGVKVSGEHLATIEEGVTYAVECLEKADRVVIEEKLTGPEFSLMSFVSGPSLPRLSLGNLVQVVHMPAVQDFKRAYEGNTGPNTGGMGSYSESNHLLPFLTKQDVDTASEINRRVAEALLKECGTPYRGILYGGFMKTHLGIKVIEFNARFGDPEALNVLPILQTDFVAVCQAIIEGTLTTDLVRFAPKATVCKYIVPKSYPTAKDERGQIVTFPKVDAFFEPRAQRGVEKPLSSPLAPAGLGRGKHVGEAKIYFGDISEDPDGTLRLGGSRTAGIVGIAPTIAEAERIAQSLCEQVEGPVRFRSDIGTEELLQKTIDSLNK